MKSPSIQIVTLFLGCLLVLGACLYLRESGQQASVRKEAEVCTRLDIFISLVQTGMVAPPDSPIEEQRAMEAVNQRLQTLIQSALLGSPCG